MTLNVSLNRVNANAWVSLDGSSETFNMSPNQANDQPRMVGPGQFDNRSSMEPPSTG